MMEPTVTTADGRAGTVEGSVTVGPVTAARLGVPVGTVVDLGVLAASEPGLVGGGDGLAGVFRNENQED